MNYNKIFEDYLDSVQEEGTYATREELELAVRPMLDIVKNHKDDTPEEWVEAIIQDNVRYLEEMRNNYPIPGYVVGLKNGNINIKMLGGNMDSTNREMREDALFDIASTTKLYTQIIAYNLIKNGIFSLNDKVVDLDSRFKNVGDLTLKDVMTFTTEFRTNGRLSDKKTISEAKDCLYNMNVVSTGKYNYNDMGMMLLKEVMENVTGKSYEELVDYFIVDKLGLNDTHLILPEKKIERFTGSANDFIGMVNDPSALSVGGFSGHAGIKTTSDDLIKFGEAISNGYILPKEFLKDAYTPGITINPDGGKDFRGIMGNTYTSHPKGINVSYLDILAPRKGFAAQGSTRTQVTIYPNSVNAILFNPASMGMERAREEEAKINARRDADHQLSLVKEFSFDRDGKTVNYNLIDARLMAPSGKTIEPVISQTEELNLRIGFLNKVIEAYDRNYNQPVNVVADAKTFRK